MHVDSAYANGLFKMHKGTVKALQSNDAQRVANVLEQERQALNAVYYHELTKIKQQHTHAVQLITYHPINVRAKQMQDADYACLKQEHVLIEHHVERLHKYCARELAAYYRLVSQLPFIPEQSSWVPDTKTITLSVTGVSGLLSQYTTDPLSKAVCIALAVVGGYASVKTGDEIKMPISEHTTWYQNKEAVLNQLSGFEKTIHSDITDLERGLHRLEQITK